MTASVTAGRALRYAGGFARGVLHHHRGHSRRNTDPLAKTGAADDLHAMDSRAIPSSEELLARLGQALIGMLLTLSVALSAVPDIFRMAQGGAGLTVEVTSLKALTHQSTFVRTVDLLSEPKSKVAGPIVVSMVAPVAPLSSQQGAMAPRDVGGYVPDRPSRPASQGPPAIV